MKKFLSILVFILPLSLNASSTVTADNILSAVNAERAAIGISTLEGDQALIRAANKRAQDLLNRAYFDHVSPEGKQFHTWISDEGYKYAIAGENLAESVNAAYAGQIVSNWMASLTHHSNIISDRYSETGVGVAEGNIKGKRVTVVVQLFAHPISIEAAPHLEVEPPSESVGEVATGAVVEAQETVVLIADKRQEVCTTFICKVIQLVYAVFR